MNKLFPVYLAIFLLLFTTHPAAASVYTEWEIKSIDTMKLSRDTARLKASDPTFQFTVDEQMQHIAESGATHVAIGTPYDSEFIPFLRMWVDAARRHNLNVWFRGNVAGWEGWFEYPKITREQHLQKTVEFVKQQSALFKDGDIFTSCPECENGGPGDPRHTGDVSGHRAFLIKEHDALSKQFTRTGTNVIVGFYSMNADVARLIMDPETTQSAPEIVQQY